MYIDKRWILPGVLSAFLFAALCVAITLIVSSRSDAGATPVASTAAHTETSDGSACKMRLAALRAATPEAAPAPPVPEQSQVNTRGFGDIGMQFQDVNVGAPITNVHISNQGNANTTNTIIGDGNTINNNQPPISEPAPPGPPVQEPPSESPGVEPVPEPAPSPSPDAAPGAEPLPTSTG